MEKSNPAAYPYKILLNGRRMGLAQSYRSTAQRSCKPAAGVGSELAQGMVLGAAYYQVEITRLRLNPAAQNDPLEDLCDFELKVEGNGGTVRYTGCQWSEVTRRVEPAGVVIETMKLWASGCQREEKTS